VTDGRAPRLAPAGRLEAATATGGTEQIDAKETNWTPRSDREAKVPDGNEPAKPQCGVESNPIRLGRAACHGQKGRSERGVEGD
jgi:hypothetical protein